LPINVTPLIGRSAAVEFVRNLVSAYRIVTLVGPGGIGKTVLAMEAVRGLLSQFSDGVWLVELASLSDSDLVASATAKTLELKLGNIISSEAVARAIKERQLSLLLDNCEHVIDAAAVFAETLIRLCPRITIVATSREALRIDGEYVYRVRPLEVPPAVSQEPEEVLGHGAVELFVSRARTLNSDFSPQPQEVSGIAEICRHLDGIPLAIEFAASRAAVLEVQPVADSLDV
jgi:predicted ATPase